MAGTNGGLTPPNQVDIPFVSPNTTSANANDVQIAFGSSTLSPGAILELNALWAGESTSVGIQTTSSLPSIDLSTGESVGHFNRQLRDRRLHVDLSGVQNPFSLGLAFSSSLIANWPSGYTQTGSYRHFYSGAVGIPLTTVSIEPLVLPVYVLTEVFGVGETAIPVYAGTAGVISAAAGETLGVILGVTFEGVGFALSAGESLSAEVFDDRRLGVRTESGESFEIELEIESTTTQFGVGEAVTLTLDVYDIVTNEQETGEELTVSLTTTVTLSNEIGAGEELTVELSLSPASYFTNEQETGEELTVSLTTTVRPRIGTATGESFELSIDLPLRTGMEQELPFGQTLSVDLVTTFSLGAIGFFDGSCISLEVDELQPYRFAAGETLTADLVTAFALPVTFYHGESVEQELDIRPPAFLSAAFATGSDISYFSMKVQVSTDFHCVLYEGTFVTATEQTSTTTYDLADPYLYVDTLDWFTERNDFEFVEMPPSFQYNKGAGVLVTVDLQCRPAFSIGFVTGESWVLESNTRYMETVLTAPTGAVYPSEFFYIEPTINLCYPNVFPNADAMEVELDFVDNTCYADFMYSGQSMGVSMSARHQFSIKQHTGESLETTLTVDKPWELFIYVGQSLTTDLSTKPAMQPRMYQGEDFEATMEEPGAQFACGESVVASLQITFDVEFLERGCLDNEYRYLKPNGFEDVDKFNPVSVELEPFAHDIKARCF